MAADRASKNETKPGQPTQLHLPVSASPLFFTHRKLRWWQSAEEGRDGGGNVCLWEHIPVHLGQPLLQTNSANPSKPRQDPGKIPNSSWFSAAQGEGTVAVSHLLIPCRVFFPFASSQSFGIASPVGKDGEETRPWEEGRAAQPGAPLRGEVVRRI